MSSRAFQRFLLVLLVLSLGVVNLPAQEPTGGGTVVRDITGGAAMIFRAPKDPVVHVATNVQGTVGGGKIKNRQPKPSAPKQDSIIARANAARSAPQPRYAEAEEQYRIAMQIAPDDARSFAGLGNVFVDQKRFAEAVAAYQQALKVNPGYTQAYLPLAFSLAALSRFPQTIKLEPQNPEVFNNLSAAYNQLNRFQDGVEASSQAIKLLGDTGQAYTQGFQERKEVLSYAYKNLGNAFNGMQRYEEAAVALKRAAEIEPTNVAAQFNLGLTLYNAGRYSEAIEAYKEAIKLRPNLAQAHFNLALTYYAISDRKQAMDEYEKLKAINPDLAAKLHAFLIK
jgi:tetratricopeptide (TPR) repeat protein